MDDNYDADIDTGMDDFDSTEPTESVTERQGDATDAVAALLLGDDGALDSFERGDDTSFNLGHIRDTESSPREAKQDAPAYMSNQSAPDLDGTKARIEHFGQQQQRVQQEIQRLEDMKDTLDPAQYQQGRDYLAGQYAAALVQQQAAQIEDMKHANWLSQQEQAVVEQHGDIWNDPQKRDLYREKVVNYLGNEMGFSSEEMANIDARALNAALHHLKTRDELAMSKIELAKLKAEHKQRQRALKQGRRDSEVGARGTKGTAEQQDEVMRLLFGGGR